MRLNTKVRYGTRALLELALRFDDGPVSVGEIAAAQGVSDKYLEALFATLRIAGLVQSVRGAQGGYRLARPPADICLREVFDALEGSEPYAPCTLDHAACQRWADCVTREVWADMYQASMQVLESTTLADLVARRCARPSVTAAAAQSSSVE
jgi:Rrf2 family protein